jgi:excalibur calcium-binding domain-containing protein
MTNFPEPNRPPARRPRLWPLVVLAALAVTGLAVLIVAAALGRSADPPTVAAPATATAGMPAATTAAAAVQSDTDPYEVWLQRAPDDAPDLTRDDALARAYLGCGQNFPPGTTDAILQEVYAEYVTCGAPAADDPRYGSCADAVAAGHGPYRRDADPEYGWYEDRDGDGVVCETE